MENLDELRDQVEAIYVAVTKLRQSGVSEKALVTLIQENCSVVGPKWAKKKIGKPVIRAVLDGMESLSAYVFPKGESE